MADFAGMAMNNRGDRYRSALVNFAFLAHAVLCTDEVAATMAGPTKGAS
jgi:hypothetical protein